MLYVRLAQDRDAVIEGILESARTLDPKVTKSDVVRVLIERGIKATLAP